MISAESMRIFCPFSIGPAEDLFDLLLRYDTLCAAARLTVEQVTAWLKSFCNGDPLDLNFRRRIIDVLVNAVYLYDDKVFIFFNVKNGKQISYIDFCADFADDPPEGESSDFNACGSPFDLKSEIYFFKGSVFGLKLPRGH